VQPALEETARKLEYLVAEDNPIIRTLIGKLLKRRGHVATIGRQRQLAVDAVRDGPLRSGPDGHAICRRWMA